MEKTMFKHYCMGQNLRRLFTEQQIPEALYPIITEYEKTFTADIRGTFLNDTLAFDENFAKVEEKVQWKNSKLPTLPKETQRLLHDWIAARDPQCLAEGFVPPTGYIRTKIGRLGQTFQVRSASLGDSNVLFNYRKGEESWSAGSITEIFSHVRYSASGAPTTQTFMLVNPYAPLEADHALLDQFEQIGFPQTSGRLLYQRYEAAQVLIAVDDVYCHFALTPLVLDTINEKLVHVLPLDRVRKLPFYS